MPYTPILGTLAYVTRGDDVLMVHRTFRDGDQHLGKFNGLGGKLEPGEDIVAGIVRELHEEAGIDALDVHLRGTISWPGFGTGGEDWFGFIFRVDAFTGEPPAANEEGTLHWVPRDRLLDLPLWEGDRHWLPMLFDDSVAQFHGVMPYIDGRPGGWSVTVVER
ncbi:MAG: 8-oxo-dGTP diphosphatase [Nigerium sp.]|nr:8-oxo-dGTP diphosphatase [Nigerium sp.]MBK8462111.1 8-oxo-dGTP diphosphatase [Nigerium sp.]